jgi:hypothetical protein
MQLSASLRSRAKSRLGGINWVRKFGLGFFIGFQPQAELKLVRISPRVLACPVKFTQVKSEANLIAVN